MSHSASRASIQYSRAVPPGCGWGVVKVSCSVGPAPGAAAAARARGSVDPPGGGVGLRRIAGLAQQHALAADRAQERTGARGQEAAAGHAAV